LFVLVGVVELSLAGLDHWSPAHWSLLVVWLACFGTAHLALCRRAPGRDPLLLPLAGLLTGWGLLLIARLADVSFLLRQSVWLVVSAAVFVLIAARPPGLRWLRRYRYTWLLSGLALLATTLVLGSNPSGYGPRLWLGRRLPSLGNVYIQPSEILKLLMVAYLSSYLAERRALVFDGPRLGRVRLPALPYLAPLLAMWGLAMVLLAWQQDLGAALLFFLTFLVMLYLVSGSWAYIVAGLVLFFVAAAGAYLFFDTVALRVDIWLDPWADPDGRAFQVVQSLIAFASGGLIGQGLGQGSPTYIPAIHTDFPFAAITEEMGLVGALGLIAALATLASRGLHIALKARSPFRRLLAAGLAALLGLQAWIIIAGNSKLIPLTGVTLPFVSYGGSSLLSSFIALALLTTVSRDQNPSSPRPPAAPATRPSALDHLPLANLPLYRIGLSLLAAFAGLALVNGYWGLARRDVLRAREDNPRLVEAEQRVRRGPILDRHGVVLARSWADEAESVQQRAYLTPTIPAVGYYSLKHGVGGIEASHDELLRGLQGRSEQERFLDELLHRQPPGRGIVLTLDAGLQERITAMMEGLTGTVVLMDVLNGEILALVSRPTYDPNTLDDDWEKLEEDEAAPLLNRATQGLYQPGGVLQIVVLAAALEAGVVELDAPDDDFTAPVRVDGRALDCASPLAGPTLADAVAAACPAPIAKLGQALSAQTLQATFRRWGLDTSPPLEIPTEAAESDTGDKLPITDPRLAAIGQESLTVTPLHMALVVATLGNDGVMPAAHLVLETEHAAGQWQPAGPPDPAARTISAALATRLRTLLRPAPGDGQVVGHGSVALAGADRPPHAWFIGLAPVQAPRYAVVVLLEHVDADGLPLAERIGHDTLGAALIQVP
jgi:cell division protein FtsW (lipid II flippase)/cell division protein FtsI/penicillin-binding protein 2